MSVLAVDQQRWRPRELHDTLPSCPLRVSSVCCREGRSARPLRDRQTTERR